MSSQEFKVCDLWKQLYPKLSPPPLPPLMKTRLETMITLFSLLPPLPQNLHNPIKDKSSKTPDNISPLYSNYTHWQQTVWHQKEMAQTWLERLWSDQLLTTPRVHIRSERELSMIWKKNETSYLVTGNQEVRRGPTPWAQTGKTYHKFFRMQRMGREGTLMQTALSLKASILAAPLCRRLCHVSPSHRRIHISLPPSGHFFRKKLKFKIRVDLPLNRSGTPAAGRKKNLDHIFISSNLAIAADSCCLTGMPS